MIAALASLALQVVTATKPLPPAKPGTPPPAAETSSKPVTSVTSSPDSVRPPDELRIAGQRYAPAVRGCYEREGLRRDPGLAANVEVTVTIDSQGAVKQVKLDTLDVHGIGMSDVITCVEAAAMHWHFSSGTYAVEEMTFTYKLVPPNPAGRDSTLR